MPILGIIASQQPGHIATGSFESIQTISGAASSYTFSSIPQTYKHLQLRITWQNATADQDMFIWFNGVNTGTSYANHVLQGSTSGTQAAYGNSNLPKWETMYDGNNAGSTTYPKVGVLDILDYSSTVKNKTARLLWGADYNGAGMAALGSALYRSTSAITSVSFQPFSTSFGANTKIALYGIKG